MIMMKIPGNHFGSYIGVDLHKCTVTLVAVGPDGEVIAWADDQYQMCRQNS